MPNNLVFNNVASNLQAQIYGQNPTGDAVAIQTDANGNIIIGAGTITVLGGSLTVLAGTVTVSGGTVTVEAGTVTVAGGTVTVAGGTVTVAGGTVTVEAGTVTVAGGTITVSGGTVTVQGSITTASDFSETSTTIFINPAAGTITALTVDTSAKTLYSFYVFNTAGTNTISARLQVAPTNTSSYFVNDTTTAVIADDTNPKAVLVPGFYLKWTRLVLSATGSTTVDVYFNGTN